MDILAISYHNIGPFRNKTLSVVFHHGKYLIQAPIGSGKSFLFFDGPIYGLYKYSTRRMLHIEEKKWFIKLLFSHQDQLYLVVRDMSAAKAKDSCKSRLFLIADQHKVIDILATHQDTLYENIDIQTLLHDAWISMEEVSFKNETDVQQSLDQLLPPRQVFVSTVFLMQDSPNIFELTPTERLLVLKNVFNLLDIDQAKDMIADRKRQLQTEKKVLSDTAQIDQKLQTNVSALLDAIHTLLWVNLDFGDITKLRDFYDEVILLRDKISIAWFDLWAWDDALLDTIRQVIEHHQKAEWILLHEKEVCSKDVLSLGEQQAGIDRDIITTQAGIDDCIKNIALLQWLSLDVLREQEQKLTTQQSDLWSKLAHDRIQAFAKVSFDDWHKLYQFITEVINEGKLLAESQKSWELQQSQLQQSLQDIDSKQKQFVLEPGTLWYDKMQKASSQVVATLETELWLLRQQQTHLLWVQKEYTDELARLEQSLQTLLHGEDSRVQECMTKIRGLLVIDTTVENDVLQILADYIGGDQLHAMQDRIALLRDKMQAMTADDTLAQLSSKIAELTWKIADISTHIQTYIPDFMEEWQQAVDETSTKKATIAQQLAALTQDQSYVLGQERMTQIKEFLLDIDWKALQISYAEYQVLQQKKEQVQNDMRHMQDRQQQLATLENKKTELQTRLELFVTQAKDIANRLAEIKEKQIVLETRLDAYPRAALQQATTLLQTIQSSVQHIRYLISDYAHNKIKVKSLLEQEEVMNNLYTIFSKELLLLVLSESLPLLADIINVFLAQVVPFQLALRVVGEDDKLELEAIISDEHGEREVKSLSGGQRVILKLVWMLALSSFMRSPLLFLDETINNLDKDTVGIVADMLADFIKKNDIKLYTITHSEQIQAMGIWDGVIKL